MTFAGLAPGFPGIYQVNVIPPANPKSNRLSLFVNGAFSNSVTLPIPAGTNVANVSGSIEGLYPASGLYAATGQFGLAGQPTSGPVTMSQMLTAAAISVSFDIVPGAKPFTVVATTPAGNCVIEIDPGGGSWRLTRGVPILRAKVGDFSGTGQVVYDLESQRPFPGNIVPPSRLDPMAYRVGYLLEPPNEVPVNSPNGTLVSSGVLPADGHFSMGADEAGGDGRPRLYFGGFADIGLPPPMTQTVQLLLFVDRMLVASRNIPYLVD